MVRSLRSRVVMVLATVALWSTGSTAAAHSDVKSIDPVDGSVLSAAPDNVVLTFTADVLPDFTQVVTTCDGTVLDLPPAVTAGNTVTQPIGPVARGVCTLVFRIVSADSHPIAGQTTFTVNAPAAASSSAPAPTASASNTSPVMSTSTPTAASPSPSPDSGDVDATSDGPSRRTWQFIGAGLVLALGALGVLFARRRE